MRNTTGDRYQLYQRNLSIMLLQYISKKLKKICFFNYQRASLTQEKKLAKWNLIFWKYMFSPKRSSENPHACQLANCQKQIYKENLRYQVTPRNVFVYTDLVKLSKDSMRFIDSQSKLQPLYKPPPAVLLNRAMVEGFYKKSDTCKGMALTFTAPRKPYKELKPVSNIKRIEHQKNVRSENIKLYEKSRVSISISSVETRDATAKILRQAIAQEEPRMHSRIEQLKLLVNEKMIQIPMCGLSIK